MISFGLTSFGNAGLIATLCAGAFIGALLLHRRRQSQGGRGSAPSTTCRKVCACSTRRTCIVVVNSRYIEMYGLSPAIVKPAFRSTN